MFLRPDFLLVVLASDLIIWTNSIDSGCKDGSTEALQDLYHPNMAACKGKWTGHVSNASSVLCASGWRVCSWMDVKMLRTIYWIEAVQIPGCYVFDASQDSFNCRPCSSNNVLQDNMAGIGNSCLRSYYGRNSCISGGRMEATCCEDSILGKSCTYQSSSVITGVLCCKLPGEPPKILSHPSSLVHVTSGKSFVLSCLTSGNPEPRTVWYRDGFVIDMAQDDRFSVFNSGYLVVANSKDGDSGVYKCMAKNRLGLVFSKPSKVIVRDHSSGCHSRRTAGLFQYEDVHACKGRWKGHVSTSGKRLCRKGWGVCDPRHVGTLKMITWYDAIHLDGCYAYDAANTLGRCLPCIDGEMAGVGASCQKKTLSEPSCLVEGSISVLRNRTHHKKGCHYNNINRIISGVLCCRKPIENSIGSKWRPPKCLDHCQNGGVCVEDGNCLCKSGFKGPACQYPICKGGCIKNSECYKPNHCRCIDGYYGPHCQFVERWRNKTKERMNEMAGKNGTKTKNRNSKLRPTKKSKKKFLTKD